MSTQNEPPEIPSFKSGAKDDEKKGGGAVSLGKPGSAPSGGGLPWAGFGGTKAGMKVRGLPGGSTVVERLKNLRKKDLAFIAAGLSVLMMAPVAEHFMMNPGDQAAGTLQQGFSERGPLFPDGSSVYEAGTGGFSPGSLLGQGADVITPLNVRDPAALVMGPGAAQKPAAAASPAVSPDASLTPKKDAGGWKDALAQAASKGVSSAVNKSAKLPRPSGKMSGALSGLAGLSGLKGGGGPSANFGPISASNVPNRARGSDSLTRTQAVPGYNGAASRSPSAGGAEALKAGGSRQADIFNRGGAANALDTASREAIPQGGGYGAGGGGPGSGDGSKGPGGNSHKDNRTLGESLEFLRLKQEMEKAIGLKWKKKEWEEFGRKKMIEEAVYKVAIENLLGKGIFEPIGKGTADFIGKLFPEGAAAAGVHCGTAGGGSITMKNTDKEVWVCLDANTAQNTKNLETRTCKGCLNFGAPGGAGSLPPPPDLNDPAAAERIRLEGSGAQRSASRAEAGAGGWSSQVTALEARIGALGGKVDQINASGSEAESKIKAAADAALVELRAAAASHRSALTKNRTARETVTTQIRNLGRANDRLGVKLQTANAVAEHAGGALTAYGQLSAPSFGFPEAQSHIDRLLSASRDGVQAVDKWTDEKALLDAAAVALNDDGPARRNLLDAQTLIAGEGEAPTPESAFGRADAVRAKAAEASQAGINLGQELAAVKGIADEIESANATLIEANSQAVAALREAEEMRLRTLAAQAKTDEADKFMIRDGLTYDGALADARDLVGFADAQEKKSVAKAASGLHDGVKAIKAKHDAQQDYGQELTAAKKLLAEVQTLQTSVRTNGLALVQEKVRGAANELGLAPLGGGSPAPATPATPPAGAPAPTEVPRPG